MESNDELMVCDDAMDALDRGLAHACWFRGANGAQRLDEFIRVKEAALAKSTTNVDRKCWLYYVEMGRYAPGIAHAMRRRPDWIRLHYCSLAKEEDMGFQVFAGRLRFLWFKANRHRFPRQLFSMGQALVNHIPNELELTHKDFLARNVRNYTRYIHSLRVMPAEYRRLQFPVHPDTFVLKDWQQCKELYTLASIHRDKTRALNEDLSTTATMAAVTATAATKKSSDTRHKKRRDTPRVSPAADRRRRHRGKASSSSSSSSSSAAAAAAAHDDVADDDGDDNEIDALQGVASMAKITAMAVSSSAGKRVDLNNTWILKPEGGARGVGIAVFGNLDAFMSDYELCERQLASGELTLKTRRLGNHATGQFCLTRQVAQRYLARPLLLDGHKFDVRTYLYVAHVDDELVFYHEGYVRVNAERYDVDCSDLGNLYRHLSNVSVQRTHPDFKDFADRMRWTFDEFQAHLSEHNLAPPNWVQSTLVPAMKSQMWLSFKSVKSKLHRSSPSAVFMMVGADFIIDCNLRVWLIEYSKSPAVFRTERGHILTRRWSSMISEAASIALEIDERKRQGESFYASDFEPPLRSLRTWQTCRPSSRRVKRQHHNVDRDEEEEEEERREEAVEREHELKI
jgi:Tubulin-tyrosine ligase family